MKIYKIIFLFVLMFLMSCNGIKNYTLEDNKVKVVKSSMAAARIKPNSGRNGEKISVLKTPIKQFKSDDYVDQLLKHISRNTKGFQIDTEKKTVSYISSQTYTFDKTDPKIMNFGRLIKPKKDKFYKNVLDFEIIGRYLNSDKFVFTIDDFKYDYSLLKIKRDYPLIIISIQFLEKQDQVTLSSAPRLIIPYKIGDPNWLSSINYQNYYTLEFDKQNFEHLELRVTEIYLDNITTAEVDAITNGKTKDLPEVLKAIADLIKKKENL